jgi:hypothetical protein
MLGISMPTYPQTGKNTGERKPGRGKEPDEIARRMERCGGAGCVQSEGAGGA